MSADHANPDHANPDHANRPPRVLVLLATYRGAAFVDQQIASILWQVDVDAHILIRDDGSKAGGSEAGGSTDDTRARCDAWAARHPDRVATIADGVRTGSASGNFFRLLAAAPLDRYDHVAFADQDDIWFPDKLAHAVAAIRAAGAAGYSCDLLAYDEAARTAWPVSKAGGEAELDYLFQGASAGCTYVLTAAAARVVRDAMASAGAASAERAAAAGDDWPRGLSHDWTIYAICRSRGLGWVRDARPGLLYRQHGGNDYGARAGIGGLLQRLRAVRDDWYRAHVSWLRRVVAMTPAERAVFAAIDRGDRRWLTRNAYRFRRTKRDARLLALTFMAGLF